jgi:hypothetical protein
VHLGFDRKPGYVHPDSVGVDHRYALNVMAIDASSGRVVWERTAYEGVMYDDRHRKNTYASPTVATDDGPYAFFESAGSTATSTASRAERFPGHCRRPGAGTSPVPYEVDQLSARPEMVDGRHRRRSNRETGREVCTRSETAAGAGPRRLVSVTGRAGHLGAEAVIV